MLIFNFINLLTAASYSHKQHKKPSYASSSSSDSSSDDSIIDLNQKIESNQTEGSITDHESNSESPDHEYLNLKVHYQPCETKRDRRSRINYKQESSEKNKHKNLHATQSDELTRKIQFAINQAFENLKDTDLLKTSQESAAVARDYVNKATEIAGKCTGYRSAENRYKRYPASRSIVFEAGRDIYNKLIVPVGCASMWTADKLSDLKDKLTASYDESDRPTLQQEEFNEGIEMVDYQSSKIDTRGQKQTPEFNTLISDENERTSSSEKLQSFNRTLKLLNDSLKMSNETISGSFFLLRETELNEESKNLLEKIFKKHYRLKKKLDKIVEKKGIKLEKDE